MTTVELNHVATAVEHLCLVNQAAFDSLAVQAVCECEVDAHDEFHGHKPKSPDRAELHEVIDKATKLTEDEICVGPAGPAFQILRDFVRLVRKLK